MTILVLIVGMALYAIIKATLRFRSGTIGRTELVLWIAFWAATGICVVDPALTELIARVLGVGRGADAVFYVSIVGLSYAFFRLYMRTRHLDHQLTDLVRRLALADAARSGRTN